MNDYDMNEKLKYSILYHQKKYLMKRHNINHIIYFSLYLAKIIVMCVNLFFLLPLS